jgi:hypothetical protein
MESEQLRRWMEPVQDGAAEIKWGHHDDKRAPQVGLEGNPTPSGTDLGLRTRHSGTRSGAAGAFGNATQGGEGQ